MSTISSTVISAVQTGASMYQAMTLILVSLTQLWHCIPTCVSRIAQQFTEILPSDTTPLGNSVLIQILSAAIYSTLLEKSEKLNIQKNINASTARKGDMEEARTPESKKMSVTSFDSSSVESISLAVAERLCRIDEDNKHTEEIEALLVKSRQSLEDDYSSKGCESIEYNQQMAEILVSDLLMSTEGKKGLKARYLRNFTKLYKCLLFKCDFSRLCVINFFNEFFNNY